MTINLKLVYQLKFETKADLGRHLDRDEHKASQPSLSSTQSRDWENESLVSFQYISSSSITFFEFSHRCVVQERRNQVLVHITRPAKHDFLINRTVLFIIHPLFKLHVVLITVQSCLDTFTSYCSCSSTMKNGYSSVNSVSCRNNKETHVF